MQSDLPQDEGWPVERNARRTTRGCERKRERVLRGVSNDAPRDDDAFRSKETSASGMYNGAFGQSPLELDLTYLRKHFPKVGWYLKKTHPFEHVLTWCLQTLNVKAINYTSCCNYFKFKCKCFDFSRTRTVIARFVNIFCQIRSGLSCHIYCLMIRTRLTIIDWCCSSCASDKSFIVIECRSDVQIQTNPFVWLVTYDKLQSYTDRSSIYGLLILKQKISHNRYQCTTWHFFFEIRPSWCVTIFMLRSISENTIIQNDILTWSTIKYGRPQYSVYRFHKHAVAFVSNQFVISGMVSIWLWTTYLICEVTRILSSYESQKVNVILKKLRGIEHENNTKDEERRRKSKQKGTRKGGGRRRETSRQGWWKEEEGEKKTKREEEGGRPRKE